MLEMGFYNMDCMDGMREFPDKYFDLAIVDPPYGDATEKFDGGGGTDSEVCLIATKRLINRTGNSWSKKYGKKLSRGTLPQRTIISWSCSASHAIKLFGAVITSGSRLQGAF